VPGAWPRLRAAIPPLANRRRCRSAWMGSRWQCLQWDLQSYHMLLPLVSGESVLMVMHTNDCYDEERGLDRNLLVPLVAVYRSVGSCGSLGVQGDL